MMRVDMLAEAWGGVRRRAEILEYPVREMIERGWISPVDISDTDALEQELCRFFRCESISGIRDSFHLNFGHGATVVRQAQEPK